MEVESLEGTRLGRFRIDRHLGRGATGDVYVAFDETLDRSVAIKVLSKKFDVEPHRRRFLREARLAARLNHPNIASIHEVGDDDRRYIVMELLEGQTLRLLLSERPLPLEEAVTLARDVARALGRAHAGDVIHRDIKPENVFITHPAPGVSFAKVLDFGLARDETSRKRNDEENTATDVSAPGEACGTAGYLAPEQARGLAIDVRADVFSFGVLFYEMLSGKRAFDGRNHLARMLAVVKSTPEPIEQLIPDLPQPVAAIVNRCLAKNPDARYPNGTAILAALDNLSLPSQAGRMSVVTGPQFVPNSPAKIPPPPETPVMTSAPPRPRVPPPPPRALLVLPTPTPTPVSSAPVSSSPISVVPLSTPQPMPSPLAVTPDLPPSPVAWMAPPLAEEGERESRTGEAAPPSTRTPAFEFAPRTTRPLWFVAVGCGLVGVGLILAALVTRSGRGAVAAAERHASVVAGARVGEDVRTRASVASPLEDAPPPPAPDEPLASASAAPVVLRLAAAPRAKPSAPVTTAAAPPPPATPVPAAPPPTTGVVRVSGNAMTVVVDGDHRRVRDGIVILPCGRHKIRAGFGTERLIDVPCGGSTSF